MKKRLIKLMTAMMFIAGCASGPESLHQDFQIYPVSEFLYRGERIHAPDIAKLKKLDIQTVISFEEDPKILESQKEFVESQGFYFHSIPVNLYRWPSDESILEYLDLILDRRNHSVYLYCEDGKDRTGTMVAVYRVMWEGLGPRKAYEEAKAYGFWPYRGNAELKKFIHQLNDRKNYFAKADEWRMKYDS